MSDRKDGGPAARPILMNGDMVRAVLDGRKTQTRRVVKVGCDIPLHRETYGRHFFHDGLGNGVLFKSNPYGKPGDLLYVRETFARWPTTDGSSDLMYKADDDPDYDDIDNWGVRMFNWTPSIHMPRCASRITLEITDVRVERLQDISEEDAAKEGLCIFNEDGNIYYSGASFDPESWFDEQWKWHIDPRYAFFELWDGIYFDAGCGVAKNPWVWVVEFKPHLKNVDAMLSEREDSQ